MTITSPNRRPHGNIELKARLSNLDAARKVARELPAENAGVLSQTDTYFHCPNGRLKLREFADRPAELIWYARDNQQQAKRSDYHLAPVVNPETLKLSLAAALGVRVVVKKRRELFLYQNVRIHLDQVDGLGEFLEFEAVLPQNSESDPDAAQNAGRNLVAWLQERFALSPESLVAESYSDLLISLAS
ncbi:MAG: class IV adenylate cyclase [Planctomycetales bacterium]